MTLSTTKNTEQYNGDGVQTVFPYTFLVLSASHMAASVDGVADPAITVDGIGNVQGGNVTFTTPPPVGVGNVLLTRVVPLQQLTDYEPYDSFPAESHEAALDYLTMIDQQQQEILDRTVTVAPGTEADYTLPTPVADKYLGWNAATPPDMVNKDHPILVGTGAPADSVGDNGSLYLAEDTGALYNKVAGSWSLIGSVYGQGVPIGGGAGQILAKVSATDFDTEWASAGSIPGGGDHADTSNRDAPDAHPADAVSYDNTTSGLAATDVQGAIDEAITVSGVGTVRQTIRTTPDQGWWLLDGKTIGNASSGADHAGANQAALFDLVKLLPPNLGTEVFANNDTVILPDAQNRVIAMCDPAGNQGTAAACGATRGAETHTLLEAEMPDHVHHISGATQSQSVSGQGAISGTPSGGGDVADDVSAAHAHALDLDTESTGSGTPFSVEQQTIFFNMEIKY